MRFFKKLPGPRQRTNDTYRSSEEELKRSIREKLANYVPRETVTHINPTTCGIVVSTGEPANLEMFPAICALVETAWVDRCGFLQFVEDLTLGKFGNVVISHKLFGELDFLKELARDQFGVTDVRTTAITALTAEQREQLDVWAGVTDRRG